MDCLNPQGSTATEPRLLGKGSNYEGPGPRRSGRATKIALSVLSLLFVILLALIIWLAVEMRHNRNDIRDLRESLASSTRLSSTQLSSVSGGSNSTLSSLEAYPAVFLSQNATTQPGYTFAGSVYRGSGYWASQPPLPSPRADFAAVTVNGTIYVTGGHDGSDAYLRSGFAYDPVRNVTEAISDLPAPRSHFAAAAPDGTVLYVIGGYASEAAEGASRPEQCSLAYNVSRDQWSSGPCLVEARGSACGAVVNGKLFVAGGVGANGTQLATIELFHPGNASWTTFARLPSARSGAGCAASGSNLIIAGGTNGTGQDRRGVYAVDSATGSVSRLASMLYTRFDFQLVGLPGGDLLAVGGGQHVNGTEVGLHNVERYSRASNQWVEKAPIANQRFAFGAAYVDEGVYAMGGHIFCNDTASEDCGDRVLESIEVLYDSDHPDVFVHIQQPGAQPSGPAPNASRVLLLTAATGVSGYTAAGSLYRGSGYWAAGQDMPQPLSDLNVVGYGDEVYIVGGLDLDAVDVSSSLYKYDPVLELYSNLSALPEPRTRGGADILRGSLYYVAGFTSADETAEAVDTMLVYDIAADAWSESAARLSSPRSDCCMAAVGGRLYVAGGYSANFTELNLAERYDPDVGAWTAIASMPTPRGDVMCAAMDGLFVVAGGFWDPTGQFTPASFRTEVQAYDPATDAACVGEWRSLAPLPEARGDAAMTVVPSQFGDRLLVVGGETQFDNERTQIATHAVQEYSATLDEWVLKAPLITPRFRHDCAFAEGRALVFGGASSSLINGTGADAVATLRPIAAVEQFFDTDNPDVFVYVAQQ